VVVVAPAAPLKSTVVPLPPLVGVIVPEIVNVDGACAVAVKFTPETFAVVMVADCVVGLNVNPVWLGVTA
jgi:hypothetical protein